MGLQNNIKLRCTVENIIYYQWKGIDCIRTVPAWVRQTKATKKAATDFGVAVKSAATMRSLFGKLMPVKPPARSLVYETDGAFRKWLQGNPLSEVAPVDGIPFFEGLSFNEAVDFKGIVQVKTGITRNGDGGLLIRWPEFNPVATIKAPSGTVQLVIRYMVATIDMRLNGESHCAEANITIPYVDEVMPPQEILVQNATVPGCLALVGVSGRYYKDALQATPINQLRWKPSAIVGSFYN